MDLLRLEVGSRRLRLDPSSEKRTIGAVQQILLKLT